MAVEKFMLALGILWSLVTLYFLLTLFPPLVHVHRRWEARLKSDGVNRTQPSWLQRLVFVPLSGLLSAVTITNALHHDFSKLTGISSGMVCLLLMFLPGLYFATGAIQRWFQKKSG